MNDVKQGQGEMIFNGGTRYEGPYKDDMRHGKGVLHLRKGDFKRCEYQRNKITRWLD